MIDLRGYIDERGNKRFAQWLEGLDAAAAAKATIALARMEQGNFSKVKGVGSGVFEFFQRLTRSPELAVIRARRCSRARVLHVFIEPRELLPQHVLNGLFAAIAVGFEWQEYRKLGTGYDLLTCNCQRSFPSAY